MAARSVARMKYGFVVPFADAREFAEAAALGERHGWDAVFTWESLYGEHAWVTLAAAAVQTSRIRLGTLLTPASRHRPWDLASMVSSVDRLSGGRVVMSVGLGALHPGWTRFEPDEGRAVRALGWRLGCGRRVAALRPDRVVRAAERERLTRQQPSVDGQRLVELARPDGPTLVGLEPGPARVERTEPDRHHHATAAEPVDRAHHRGEVPRTVSRGRGQQGAEPDAGGLHRRGGQRHPGVLAVEALPGDDGVPAVLLPEHCHLGELAGVCERDHEAVPHPTTVRAGTDNDPPRTVDLSRERPRWWAPPTPPSSGSSRCSTGRGPRAATARPCRPPPARPPRRTRRARAAGARSG